jgi:hypothetical protein
LGFIGADCCVVTNPMHESICVDADSDESRNTVDYRFKSS